MTRPRGPAPYGLLLVLGILLIAAYYSWHWRSLSGFLLAIDHCDGLFADFVIYCRPMGRDVLRLARPIQGYLYSAFAALLLLPFGLLPVRAAIWAWGTVQILCLLVVCALPVGRLLKLSRKEAVLYVGLIAICLPVLHNFAWGQVSVLMVACVLGAFHAHTANRRILAGSLLAFAAAIKYYPALFVLYFLIKRDGRALAAFVVAGLVFYAALPAVVLGPSGWVAFESASWHALADTAWVSADINSQYIVHVGLRWIALLGLPGASPACALALTLVGVVVGCLSIAATWRLQHRPSLNESALSLTALFLALPFLVKTSWPHYFAYLPFCQMALATQLNRAPPVRRAWRVALGSLILLSIALSSVFVFNCFGHWRAYSAHGLLFLANALLLVPVYAIAFSDCGRRRGMQ